MRHAHKMLVFDSSLLWSWSRLTRDLKWNVFKSTNDSKEWQESGGMTDPREARKGLNRRRLRRGSDPKVEVAQLAPVNQSAASIPVLSTLH